jgi:hypothetical protein
MSFGFSASDFLALPQFAWKVYKACRDSPGDYKELASEVDSMYAVLCEVNILKEGAVLNSSQLERLATLEKGCRDLLNEISLQLRRFEGHKKKRMRIRDRLLWSMEGIGESRVRLVSHTAMLSLFCISATSLVLLFRNKRHSI